MVVCDEAEDAIGRGTSQSTEWQARDEHREHCVARSGRAQRMKCVYSCEANGQRVTCSGLADSEGSFMRKLWEWVSLVRSRTRLQNGDCHRVHSNVPLG